MDPLIANATVLVSVAEASKGLVDLAQLLVGGFVGLYIISIILTYFTNRKIIKLLDEIRNELKGRK